MGYILKFDTFYLIRFSLEINFCHLKRVLSIFVFNGLLLINYLFIWTIIKSLLNSNY